MGNEIKEGQIRQHADGRYLLVGERYIICFQTGGIPDRIKGPDAPRCCLPIERAPGCGRAVITTRGKGYDFTIPAGWVKHKGRRSTTFSAETIRAMKLIVE